MNPAAARASLAALLLVACAKARTPLAAGGEALAPDHVLGIALRQPLHADAFVRQHCSSARQFAFRRGSYSIVTDDVLFGVPHEHQDTAAVLAALDSFTVCAVETKELNATAIVTLRDSVVTGAHVFWPDESRAPEYDRILASLQHTYGEPYHHKSGVRYWSADSMDLTINHRGFYTDGTSLSLGDARGCDRYERLVHRPAPAPVYTDSLGNRDPRSNHCWVRPGT